MTVSHGDSQWHVVCGVRQSAWRAVSRLKLFFLCPAFPCLSAACTLSSRLHQLDMAKEPELALFHRLDGFQKSDITELRDGTHVFAVYGKDNHGCFVSLRFVES